MHIAIFSESFAPVVNGVSVSIELLASRLERRGHQVSCFAPSYPGHTDRTSNVFRFRSVLPARMRDYPVAVPPAGGLYRQFKDMGVDIVHTHTPFVVGLYGLKWARRLGIPLVSTNHTLYTEYSHYVYWMPGAVTRAATVAWMRSYYNRCHQVIVPSRMTGELLESYGVRTPWTAVPTGIEFFPQATHALNFRQSYEIPPGDRLLLYVGRVAPEKNLAMLVEAFARVASGEPSLRLVLVGAGPYEGALEGLARRLHVDSRVTLTGRIARDDLPSVFKEAELFVFPSTTETQGLAIGEAALHGVPAVVVNEGGAPEFVEDGKSGLLVPDSAGEFARAVQAVLEDDALREEMSQNARAVAEGLSVDSMVDRILQVYEQAREKAYQNVRG